MLGCAQDPDCSGVPALPCHGVSASAACSHSTKYKDALWPQAVSRRHPAHPTSLNSASIWGQLLDPNIPAGTLGGRDRQGFQKACLLAGGPIAEP